METAELRSGLTETELAGLNNLSINTPATDIIVPSLPGPGEPAHGLPPDESSIAADLYRLNDALNGFQTGTVKPSPSTPVRVYDPSAVGQESFQIGKRIFDIVFAACALTMLLPVLVLCAAAIRAESPGTIFFRQRRRGKGGRFFSIVKFRTMVPNAEAVLNGLLESNPIAKKEWNTDRKLRNDPRVTRLGRFMRRSSLDELPQFWNVLTGEMSVVGPRPIVDAEISYYDQAYASYTAVRPGITGLWQVSGRNDTGYGQRVALDCQYVASRSAMLDLQIIFKTIRTVICGAGAY